MGTSDKAKKTKRSWRGKAPDIVDAVMYWNGLSLLSVAMWIAIGNKTSHSGDWTYFHIILACGLISFISGGFFRFGGRKGLSLRNPYKNRKAAPHHPGRSAR